MSKARELNNRFAVLCCILALLNGPTAIAEEQARLLVLADETDGFADTVAEKRVAEVLKQLGLIPFSSDYEDVETRKDLLFLLTISGASPRQVMKSLSANDYSGSDGSGLIPWCRDYLLEESTISGETLRRIFPMISGIRQHGFFKLEGNLDKFLEIGKRVSAFETKEPQYKEQKYRILKALASLYPYYAEGRKDLALAVFKASLENPGQSQSSSRDDFNTAISVVRQILRSNSSCGPTTAANLRELKYLLAKAAKFDLPGNHNFSSYVVQLIPDMIRQQDQKAAFECMDMIAAAAKNSKVDAMDMVKFNLFYGCMLEQSGRLRQAEKYYEDAVKIYREAKDGESKFSDRQGYSIELLKLFQAGLQYKKRDDRALDRLVSELLDLTRKNRDPDSREIGVVASELRRLTLYRAKKYKAAAAVEVDDYPTSFGYLKSHWRSSRIPDPYLILPSVKDVLMTDLDLFKKVGDEKALAASKQALESLDMEPGPNLSGRPHLKIEFDSSSSNDRKSMRRCSEAYRKKILASDLTDKEKVEHLSLRLMPLFQYDLYSESDKILDDQIRLLKGVEGNNLEYLRRALNEKALIAIGRGDLVSAKHLIEEAQAVMVPDNDESIMVSSYLEGRLALAGGDCARAEVLLSPLDSQKTLNNSDWHNFFRRDCLLSLAKSQYRQDKVAEAKLSLLKGARKYILRGYHASTTDPEYSALLALCFIRTGHPSLGKNTLFKKAQIQHSTSPTVLANQLLSQGEFASLEGNNLRAQRFYNAGINVLKDAEFTCPEGLLKSPVGVRLAALIDTRGLLDSYFRQQDKSKDGQSASRERKETAKRREEKNAATVKNLKRLEESQKLLLATDKEQKPVDYFFALQAVADGYDFYVRDDGGHIIREKGSLEKAVSTNKKALDFYIDSAKNSKWRENQIEQSFKVLTKLLGRITMDEFYQYFAKLLDVAESRMDDTGGDWTDACYNLLNYDRRLPEDRESGITTPRPDKERCYKMWLAARTTYRGAQSKKLAPLLSNLASCSKDPEQIKTLVDRHVNLDGMTPDEKFYVYISLANRYAYFGKPKESEQALIKGCEFVHWHFPDRADHSFDFLLRAYTSRKYPEQRERLLEVIMKHPNKRVLEKLDRSFEKILAAYYKEKNEAAALQFVEQRVAASELIPDSDPLSKWKLKLSELYLKSGKKVESQKLFDRVLASYRLIGRSTEDLEEDRREILKQAQ